MEAQGAALVTEDDLRLTLPLLCCQQKHIWGTFGAHPELLGSNPCIDKGAIEDSFLLAAGIVLIDRDPTRILKIKGKIDPVV